MSLAKHGRPCTACGSKTYRQSLICRRCDPAPAAVKPGPPRRTPDPSVWPEDYLMRCAQELLRRHNERHELLVKLGIKAVAA